MNQEIPTRSDTTQEGTNNDQVEIDPRTLTRASCVKFTEQEYQRLKSDSETSGVSIPKLLKRIYFKREAVRVLMPPQDIRAVQTQLRGMATNINQMAKKLNSGFRAGWNDVLERMANDVAVMRQFITGFGGNH